MPRDDPGMQALAEAARRETARIYSQFSPEHAQPRDLPLSASDIDYEIDHFHAIGWKASEIAEKLNISKARVARRLLKRTAA